MKYLKGSVFSLFFCGLLGIAQSQELDMLSELEEEDPVETLKAIASYKTTKVINSHSLENTHKGVLDFRISHRFGLISSGIYDFFGLDQATMRMGFDYGITDRLQIGIGRSTYEKTVDGFAKYKLLWQSQNSNKMPVSLLVASGFTINTQRFQALPYDMTLPRRMAYFHQLIVGRKFTDKFTLQLMPTIVHRNLVSTRDESNTVMAAGMAGRYKLIKRLAINAEYYYVLPDQLRPEIRNTLSVGVDIETGGHVFQLFFSNSLAFIEKAFITESTANWLDGDIHFGFTISRVFTIAGKNKHEEEEW